MAAGLGVQGESVVVIGNRQPAGKVMHYKSEVAQRSLSDLYD
jgi:hypothetical protein